jgi:hypothetical protein
MEQTREVFNHSLAELERLQEAMETTASDAWDLCELKSLLLRINVWGARVGLTTSPKLLTTSHGLAVSSPIIAHIKSLLDDLSGLCKDGKLFGKPRLQRMVSC